MMACRTIGTSGSGTSRYPGLAFRQSVVYHWHYFNPLALLWRSTRPGRGPLLVVIFLELSRDDLRFSAGRWAIGDGESIHGETLSGNPSTPTSST